MKKILVLAVLWLTAYPVSGQTNSTHDMAGLEFEVPDGWAASVEGFTITVAKDDKKALMLISHLPYPKSGLSLPGIKKTVEETGLELLPHAVEKELVLHPFDGGLLKGFYSVLTDKAPKPGEYKIMAQGILLGDQLHIPFTLLYNDPQNPREQAFSILSSLKPSSEKPNRIYPLLIEKKEVPSGFNVIGWQVGGEPRCHSVQPAILYQGASLDQELDSAFKIEFSMYQSFVDVHQRPALLLFIQFANSRKAVPFVEGLLWGPERRPTAIHPEHLFVKNDVVVILCIPPGGEKVYDWLIEKYQ